MNTQIAPIQLILPIAVLAGLAIAGFFGINIAQENYTQLSFIAIAICVLAWAIVGRKIWWLPIFFFAYLGGNFYFGFRIYAHELAVLLCLLPLVITLAMKRDHFKDRHFPIPASVIILILYLGIHFIACVVHNKVEGIGGLGNVSRRYMDAFWPFLVFVPFLLVGNTKYVPWALLLVTAGTVIRFSLGMWSTFFGDEGAVLFIPGINFVPAGGFAGGDLRVSGSMLCAVAICYFCIKKNILLRTFLVLVMGVGIYGTFLGGGRVTIIVLALLFGSAFLIYRRYGALLIAFSIIVIAVGLINSSPEVLQQLPRMARRAATAFILDKDSASAIGETQISDDWHFRLMEEGYKSWTEDLFVFLFGRGTGPFDASAWMEGKNFEGMVEMAVATSRFESALWSVLCTFGLVGFVLYAVFLFKIIGSTFPILMRDKIKTPVHAIMFFAVFLSITWFFLSWIAGTFPSTEILFGIVAMVAAHDMKRQSESGKAEHPRGSALSVSGKHESVAGKATGASA